MRRRGLLVAALLLIPACGDEQVGVDSPDRPGRAVLSLDRDTGSVLWRKEIAPPAPATDPVLAGDVVLVPGGAELIAYDARYGTRLWTLSGYDAVVPQAVGATVVLTGDDQVVAVEARSGRELWRAGTGATTRTVAGTGGVAVLEEGSVRLLGLGDGLERWRADLAEPPAAASTTPEGVAVAGLRGGVALLAPVDGRELWRAWTGPVSSVLLAGDRVVVRLDGALSGFDASDGRPVWSLPAGPGGPPLEATAGLLLESAPGAASSIRRISDGTVTQELLPDGDVALTRRGPVQADGDTVRGDGWTVEVSTGERPSLWLDADDELVLAVVGWGQPPTRD